MREIEERYLGPITALTGLDGEPLAVLAGTALATASLGKIPERNDLAFFLGISRGELDALSKTAIELAWNSNLKRWGEGYLEKELVSGTAPSASKVYYATATFLISKGYYLTEERESLAHARARKLLNYLPVLEPAINTKSLFCGYNIALEYVWWVARGSSDIDLRRFMAHRYGKRSDTVKNLQTFCDFIRPHKGLPYQTVMQQLVTAYKDMEACEGE